MQIGVQASAPSLPMMGHDGQSVTSTSNSQAFAGFTNVSQSHDSTRVASHGGRLTGPGRPPSRDRSRSNAASAGLRSLPFSDIGIDRKFALAGSHDRKAVI